MFAAVSVVEWCLRDVAAALGVFMTLGEVCFGFACGSASCATSQLQHQELVKRRIWAIKCTTLSYSTFRILCNFFTPNP